MQESDDDRSCTNCGKSIEDQPYRFWLFHTCQSCAAERAPKRWGDTGTCRKWRYYPRWHLVEHPNRDTHLADEGDFSMSQRTREADYPTEAGTDSDSKTVMLRAERDDEILVDDEHYQVLQRQQTYFGPLLLLQGFGEVRYQLFAPGPYRNLRLLREVTDSEGFRVGWDDCGLVEAELKDTKQYDICDQCGEPLKTAEHEKDSAYGLCER